VWRTALLLLFVTIALTGVKQDTARGADMQLGFLDDVFQSRDPTERAQWLTRAAADGSDFVRISLHWSLVAPNRPNAPTDPSDRAYRWGTIDDAVESAAAHGQRILLTFSEAPDWAQEIGARRRQFPGAWKPSVADLGQFAMAAARRYSKRVKYWQVWNEPNLPKYLAPQWERRNGSLSAFAPARYRAMQNAVYRAVKAVAPDSRVITAGTAPYGDLARGAAKRIMPVLFWKKLLTQPTYFDAFAHHPYGVRGPFSHALNPNDVAIPDLGKLRRVVDRASAKRLARPAGRKPAWITEISWDSSPPDPYGVRAKRHARWLQEALYVLWTQGVRVVLWYRIRDQAKGRGWAFTNQSGIYLRDGSAKPARAAFSLPFVAQRLGKRRVQVWGMARPGEVVRIEQRRGRDWRRVARVTTSKGNRVFAARLLSGPSATTYRAVSSSAASLAYQIPSFR
jgi:hypothetical protein